MTGRRVIAGWVRSFGAPLLVTLLAAPIATSAGAGAAPARDLTVFAAASLSDAFRTLGAAFERAHPGVRVRFSFAGSQQLATQLEQGAAAGVFAAADARAMERVASRGLANGAPRVFARNTLVLIVPRANPARIAGPADLSRRGVKLVLGADAVPVGRYAREALARLAGRPGYAPDFAARALANVVSEEESVLGVVSKVELGEADAGICYRSDVAGSAAARVRAMDLPDSAAALAEYSIVSLAGAASPPAARAFVEFALSPTGQATLERHGFLRARR